jgi:hypothetical protein
MDNHGADMIAQWRDDAEQGNPAGPLFSGGAFAEAEITSEAAIRTIGGCGTACTGSYTRYCC